MPTPLTHAVVGASLAAALPPSRHRIGYCAALAFLAAAPDLDLIGFFLGLPYSSVFGHRGILHSLPFAALMAAAITLLAARSGLPERTRPAKVFALVFVAVGSHGLLDAMTNGGLGVGLFSPLLLDRFFFPFRPIEVSPFSPSRLLSDGRSIFGSEILWVWIPAAFLMSVFGLFQKRLGTQRIHTSKNRKQRLAP